MERFGEVVPAEAVPPGNAVVVVVVVLDQVGEVRGVGALVGEVRPGGGLLHVIQDTILARAGGVGRDAGLETLEGAQVRGA